MDGVKSRGPCFREKEKDNHKQEGISSCKESSTGMEDRQAEHQPLS